MLFQHTFRHYVGLHDDILAQKIEVDDAIVMCWVMAIMFTELFGCKCGRWHAMMEIVR